MGLGRVAAARMEINKTKMNLNFIESVCYFERHGVWSADDLMETSKRRHPLLMLSEEDLDFITQFVLASGSLKEMAHLHQVSYPTIRLTLDRLIANLQKSVNGEPQDPMTGLLADLVERGEIKVAVAKNIRAVHRSAIDRIVDREEP